jgi:hypothetical protein
MTIGRSEVMLRKKNGADAEEAGCLALTIIMVFVFAFVGTAWFLCHW